jgi:hypothetical protein
MSPLAGALPRLTSTPRTTADKAPSHDAVPIAVRRAAIRQPLNQLPKGVDDNKGAENTEWGDLVWYLHGKASRIIN